MEVTVATVRGASEGVVFDSASRGEPAADKVLRRLDWLALTDPARSHGRTNIAAELG